MQTRDGHPASPEAAYTSYVPRPADLDPLPATPRRVLALPCPTPPSEKKASLPIHGAKIGPKKYHRVLNWQRGVKFFLGNSQIYMGGTFYEGASKSKSPGKHFNPSLGFCENGLHARGQWSHTTRRPIMASDCTVTLFRHQRGFLHPSPRNKATLWFRETLFLEKYWFCNSISIISIVTLYGRRRSSVVTSSEPIVWRSG